MQTYKIKWQPVSSLGTELQSDTIFGHFCWSVNFLYGEESLKKMLQELAKEPILLFSSGFPQGFLPVPRPLPISSETWLKTKEFLSIEKQDNWDLYRKKLKKVQYIPVDIWKELSAGYSWLKLFWKYLENDEQILQSTDLKEIMKEDVIIHNQINRISQTTQKDFGGPFAEITTFFADKFFFESYLKTDYYSKEELGNIFQHMTSSGFGRNKSTGQGYLKIEIKPFEFDNTNAKVNAWMTLSNMIPDKNDSINAFYEGFTKYPKLGGVFAMTQSPFKKPMFVFKPGAVFVGTTSPRGSLIENIHHNKEIVQNLYAISLPINIEEEL